MTMRKVILTSPWRDKKVGDIVELDNDEASLTINTGFGKMHPDTIAAEAEVAKKQAETPALAHKAPDISTAAAKKAEEHDKKKHDK
jgi:hypothetical protein